MKSFFLGLGVAAVSAGFPSFDSFHAHCALSTSVAMDCTTAQAAIDAVINGNEDRASPKGTYTMKQETAGQDSWATRKTANGKYTDDVYFGLAAAGNSCTVNAKSRSQSLSYIDNNVNYCNMWNVFKVAFPEGFSTPSASQCKFPASAGQKECDRY